MTHDEEPSCFQRGELREVLSFRKGFSYNEKCGTVTGPVQNFVKEGALVC